MKDDLSNLRTWLATYTSFKPDSAIAQARALLAAHDARQADPVPTPGDPTFMIDTLVNDVDKILENLDIGDKLLDEGFEAVSEEFDRVDDELFEIRSAVIAQELRLQALEQSALSKVFSPKPEVQANSFMIYLNGEVHEEPEPDSEWVEQGHIFPTRAAAEKEVARRKVMLKLKGLADYAGKGAWWAIVSHPDHGTRWTWQVMRCEPPWCKLGDIRFNTERSAQHAIDVLGTELEVLLP